MSDNSVNASQCDGCSGYEGGSVDVPLRACMCGALPAGWMPEVFIHLACFDGKGDLIVTVSVFGPQEGQSRALGGGGLGCSPASRRKMLGQA